ncbi:MAG TPA: SMI1/KNR4 family protein [Archangium sp.]|nr:SMI1/KNR4 family protein [Archangium sp.]
MAATDVRKAWRRIEDWMRENLPRFTKALQPPASPETIQQAEATVGVPFPSDLREFLSVHDGQSPDELEVFARWAPLSLERIVSIWQRSEERVQRGVIQTEDNPDIRIHGPVRPRWWDRAWIPFAKDAEGDLLCLDLNPPPGGQHGQVILFIHDADKREVVAPSLGSWLERLAGDFESGRYAVEPAGLYLEEQERA